MANIDTFETMTDKRLHHLESTLVEIQGTLRNLYGAIVGDEKFDQKGIISRIKKIEAEQEEHKTFRNKVLGGAVFGGVASGIIFELVKHIIYG